METPVKKESKRTTTTSLFRLTAVFLLVTMASSQSTNTPPLPTSAPTPAPTYTDYSEGPSAAVVFFIFFAFILLIGIGATLVAFLCCGRGSAFSFSSNTGEMPTDIELDKEFANIAKSSLAGASSLVDNSLAGASSLVDNTVAGATDLVSNVSNLGTTKKEGDEQREFQGAE